MTIRPATPDDCPQIAALWNHYIRTTTVTFTTAEKSVVELKSLLIQKAQSQHPFLVATNGAGLLGFATYSLFRNGPGYGQTVEHSIMLAEHAHGTGLGRKMITDLAVHARAQDIHSFIAGISAENTDAIAFHTRCGFRKVSHIPEVGRKFDRWHYLILMQKFLN